MGQREHRHPEPLRQPQPGFTYTQWEAYLALYHQRPLFVYRPTDFEDAECKVPRTADRFVFNHAEWQAQQAHYQRISALGHDRGLFLNEERLSSAVLRDLVEILPRLAARIDVPATRLQHTAEVLIGRDAELTLLDAAWNDPHKNVVVVRGKGGEGKTSLVASWMAELALKDWRGAECVYDWSFYSQGTRDQGTATAEPFTLEQELKPFGAWVGKPIWVPPKDSAETLSESMLRETRPFAGKEKRWAAVQKKHRADFTQVREFDLFQASIRLPQGKFFVTVTEQKDFATLLRAFARLAGGSPAPRLVILGEGPERPALEAQVRALGLGERVRLPGFRRELPAFLARAALFVHSSRWEGSPNVVAEALALGCPVVAAAGLGATAELLGGGRFGRLVAPGHAEALAQACREALADPGNPAERRARAEEFGAAGIARRYLEVLGWAPEELP